MGLDMRKVTKMFNTAKAFANLYQDDIMIGFGIAGYISAISDAFKAGPKIERALDRGDKAAYDEGREYTAQEKIMDTWKYWTPVVLKGAASTGLVLGGHSITAKRNAGLAVACSAAQNALIDYKDTVKEVLPEKKKKDIDEKYLKKRMSSVGAVSSDNLHHEPGDVKMFDEASGRFFMSTVNKVNAAWIKLKDRVQDEMYVSVNDFYSELDNPDLKPCTLGESRGWSVDNYMDGDMEVYTSGAIVDDLGQPCICVVFDHFAI